jgi:hypothetical protein
MEDRAVGGCDIMIPDEQWHVEHRCPSPPQRAGSVSGFDAIQ